MQDDGISGLGGAMSLGQATSKRSAKKPKRALPERVVPPSNFSLAKYVGAAQLEAAQWAAQFEKRRLIQAALQSGASNNPSFADQWVPSLIESPLAPFEFEVKHQASSKGEPRPSYFQSKVRPLRVKDLERLARQVPPSSDPDQLLDECFGQAACNALLWRGHLEVDLDASDALLKEQFSAWLQGARVSVGRPELVKHKGSKNFSAQQNVQRAAEDWTKFCVLPYLDLTLWWAHQRVALPSKNEWLTILFPGAAVEASRMRTVQDHVEQCLEYGLIAELLAFGQ